MDREKIKDKIIRGSVDLFMAYGIKSVTMDDIAKHLSMSKKTIYLYFKDKEEIILLSTQARFADERHEMEDLERTSRNSIEHLHNISRCMREKVRNLNPSLLYDLEKYYSDAWTVYQDYMRDVVFKSLIRTLDKGKREGYFRKDINSDILARLRMQEIRMSFDLAVFPADRFSITDVHEQIYDHFIYGILTQKGLNLLHSYQEKTSTYE